jgi:ribonuclease P protein component
MLPSSLETLKKRADFLATAASGHKCGTKGMMVQMLPAAHICADEKPPNIKIRFGLTASKRVGNAVCRNRAKRRLRALARTILPLRAKVGCSYVLIARPDTITRDTALLRGDLLYALKKLGALRPQV